MRPVSVAWLAASDHREKHAESRQYASSMSAQPDGNRCRCALGCPRREADPAAPRKGESEYRVIAGMPHPQTLTSPAPHLYIRGGYLRDDRPRPRRKTPASHRDQMDSLRADDEYPQQVALLGLNTYSSPVMGSQSHCRAAGAHPLDVGVSSENSEGQQDTSCDDDDAGEPSHCRNQDQRQTQKQLADPDQELHDRALGARPH
jgi:hypothetical protein